MLKRQTDKGNIPKYFFKKNIDTYFYKDTVYNDIEVQICYSFKSKLRIRLRLKFGVIMA